LLGLPATLVAVTANPAVAVGVVVLGEVVGWEGLRRVGRGAGC
jgi:hypothetical protein